VDPLGCGVSSDIWFSPKWLKAFNACGPNGRQLPANTTIKPAAASSNESCGGREKFCGEKGGVRGWSRRR